MNKKGFSEVLLIMLVGIVAIGGAGYWYINTQTADNEAAKSTPTITPNIAEPSIPPTPQPTMEPYEDVYKLKGYYLNYEGTQWEWFNEEVFCEGFVTLDGDQSIIDEYTNRALRGNTLNKIINDQLVVNIDLGQLAEDQKQTMLNSKPDKPVEISFVKKAELGAGVSTCYSLIEIQSVKLTN